MDEDVARYVPEDEVLRYQGKIKLPDNDLFR